MTIDIICPIYNAEKYVLKLTKAIRSQKKVNITNVFYILTESNDKTEELLLENKIDYLKIPKNKFSHSITRERISMKSDADILCFISQDIIPQNDLWLYNLVKDIENGQVEATYSRQISKFNNIEKYTREFNYPELSQVKTKEDLKKLGLRTFFFSDASSAIRKDIFIKLNGYDGKNLPINEDMYIAYKIIMNGYKIKYCSDSVVYHSHNMKLKEIYNRYKSTGKFFKENNYLDKYKTNKTGGGLAKYIIKRAFQDGNIRAIFRFLPDMGARYLGMKEGKR